MAVYEKLAVLFDFKSFNNLVHSCKTCRLFVAIFVSQEAVARSCDSRPGDVAAFHFYLRGLRPCLILIMSENASVLDCAFDFVKHDLVSQVSVETGRASLLSSSSWS